VNIVLSDAIEFLRLCYEDNLFTPAQAKQIVVLAESIQEYQEANKNAIDINHKAKWLQSALSNFLNEKSKEEWEKISKENT
jgi:coenzyme F420-reducing hydrogenase alpha subunit